MSDAPIEITAIGGLGDIPAAEWDACACPESADGGRPRDPFTTHRFLLALETSGSVGPGTGWAPRHLVARRGGGAFAVAPLYVKHHSQGEYIFDWNWAHAYENAGGGYYPKLQIAVPFTPVTGRRFLTAPGMEEIGMSALLSGAVKVAESNGLSGVHATFCTADEAERGRSMGFLGRLSQQFHWRNEGYADFDGFLAGLSSRKRKSIRRERERARDFGGRIEVLTGGDIEPRHWDSFWTFYQDTGSRKWGMPYLTREFFDIAHETMRDDMLLVLAFREGRAIAGALNFLGRESLFGRYWGCVEHHPFLHFELCYYQAIEAAISRGLDRVEAGAQGEHKLARGYLPSECHSLHWFGDRGFAGAVSRYLEAERNAVDQEIEILTSYGPFRNVEREEHD